MFSNTSHAQNMFVFGPSFCMIRTGEGIKSKYFLLLSKSLRTAAHCSNAGYLYLCGAGDCKDNNNVKLELPSSPSTLNSAVLCTHAAL